MTPQSHSPDPTPSPDLDPHDIAATIASAADRVRAAAQAGTVPPASATQLAQLLDTAAATLNTEPATPPEIPPDDAGRVAEPPS